MGECPEWYSLYQAARYMNVPPYELVKQSVWWRDKAVLAINAEAQAQETIDNMR